MSWQDVALAMAGIVGCGVAVFHGIVTQRLMVTPIADIADRRLSRPIQRLVPLLLQFSTFNWFLGGLALVAAAFWLGQEARLATALLVGSSYLFGAVANLWGTRGRHPGWMLLAVAVILIVVSLVMDQQLATS